VDVAAAELLGRHLLPRGRPHERRATEVDGALLPHDDVLVAHGGHVGAARRGRTEDDRDLRDAGGGHHRLVVEDAPTGREDLRLQGKEGPARVDEIDAREPVLERDLLGAELLLDGQRVERAALHGHVVGDHHDLPLRDGPDTGHEPARRRGVPVDPFGAERRQLQERRPRIEEALDALAHEQSAPLHMPAARLG